MMKVSGSALVCSLVFHLFLVVAASRSPRQSDSVIIIGAGMSGIMAAKTLEEGGYKDYIILEAGSRIGGRIHKGSVDGNTIEMGANWLFSGGPKSSPAHQIAKKINLRTVYSDFANLSSNIYKQGGGLYEKHAVQAALKAADARQEFGTKLSKILSSEKGRDDDVSVLGSQRLFKQVPRSPLDMAVDFYYNDFEEAEPTRISSLKNTFPRQLMEDFGEDSYFVADPRGFETVVHHIANQFLQLSNNNGDKKITDHRLMLNKTVTKIDQSKNKVTVTTEDGSTYQANYAIVTVSLGVLQSNLIQFIPPLPLWKKLAINNFDMAVYTKIFMKFPYKFWPTGPGTEFFLYAHERRGYYTIWQHLENELPGKNMVFVTVTDEESKRIEQQSDDKTKAEIMEVLKKMFGKDDIPEPESMLVPRWYTNRLFRGTYSNWPFGYTLHNYHDLQQPIRRIYFAGEHTNSTYLGYVDGAYFSGINTANALIKCLKQSCEGRGRRH